MLVGASTFAYTVSSIVSIVESFGEETKEFHTNIDLLNTYMAEYSFPEAIRTSLRMYFMHCRFGHTATNTSSQWHAVFLLLH